MFFLWKTRYRVLSRCGCFDVSSEEKSRAVKIDSPAFYWYCLFYSQYDSQDIWNEPKSPYEDAEFTEILFGFGASFPIGVDSPCCMYSHQKKCQSAGNTV